MKIENGGAAFPGKLPMSDVRSDEARDFAHFGGMTLRDYFAAKAMQSFLVGSVLPPGFDYAEQMAHMAAIAYGAADCMLVAREVTP